jgi:hypothetical protein
MDTLNILSFIILLVIVGILVWAKIEPLKGYIILLLAFSFGLNGSYMGYRNGQVDALKGKTQFEIKYTKYELKTDSVKKTKTFVPCDSIIVKKLK